MEKINIAELLKDCPRGMELYSPIFGEVYLDKIRPHLGIVVTTDKEQGDFKEEFIFDGRYGMKGECMLFPSKGKATWEGFVPPCKFKDGDVISDSLGTCIFKGEGVIQGTVDYYCGVHGDYFIVKENTDGHYGDIVDYRLATEEEKQKLFDAIKANGYKWNPETKTLEKLIEPKFKVGDKVRHKNNHGVVFTITSIEEDSYVCGAKMAFWFDDQDDYELISNKFDITTLKPFDKVLARDNDSQKWSAELFSFYDNDTEDYRFLLVGAVFARCCIPYEGNEHLLGKTDDCYEFYKTWE